MMIVCRFKYLLDIVIAVNKFYQAPSLKPSVRVKLLKLARKLKEEEKIFVKIKDDIALSLCKKDSKGKPITKKQNINGVMMDIYDFEQENKIKYQEKILPVLETEIKFEFETIKLKLEDVCNSPLYIKDIDVLMDYGILIEGNDEDDRTKKPKIITANH